VMEVYDADEAGGSQLINLSTRSPVGTGSQVQIAGFVIAGTHPKQVLLRGSGSALAAFKVSGTLTNPVLDLFSGEKTIASNIGWRTAANSAEVKAAAEGVGAFPFADTSVDSAVLIELSPGAYTTQVSGRLGGTGIALVEVYDVN